MLAIIPLVRAGRVVLTELTLVRYLAEAYRMAGEYEQARHTSHELMETAHDCNARWYLGYAHLSLGEIALRTNLEEAAPHFEEAIAYSHGRDLMAKVEYARHYARLVFDQSLHDRLLKEVLRADPLAEGLTLSNVMAQQQAKKLLKDDYF